MILEKSNSANIPFSYLILFVFVLLEVIFFDSKSIINTLISYMEVLFILIVYNFLHNSESK